MKSRCRISTRITAGPTVPGTSAHPRIAGSLRFETDSKSLSGFLGDYTGPLRRPTPPLFQIGRERAFTEVPAKYKVLEPKAARRKL
jgi:hypothetical protein